MFVLKKIILSRQISFVSLKIMSRKVNLTKLAINIQAELNKSEKKLKPQVKKQAKTETSPFFSPLKTRAQRIVESNQNVAGNKVQSQENSSEDAKKPKVAPRKRKAATAIKDENKTETKTKVTAAVSIKKPKLSPKVRKLGPINGVVPDPDIEDCWKPINWEQMIKNIREMRKDRSAPVDTMGCHRCSDDNADEKTQRFHHLIALMLSSQTKDQVTFDAMIRLKAHGLTPAKLCEIGVEELADILKPVGFHNSKAKHIKNVAKILVDQYDSDIPNTIDGLIALPGVGPKMAHICMRIAWNIVSGIGVDTHVHRISNRLKWVKNTTKQPEQTRIELEKWLPINYWSEVNELLVGFGQTICTPTNPKCSGCLNYEICPSRIVKKE